MGEARHHSRWRELTADEEAAAVAALRELAGGRADLLAEVAGVMEGFSGGEADEPLSRQAAELCRKVGADPEAIAGWIEKGRRQGQPRECRRRRVVCTTGRAAPRRSRGRCTVDGGCASVNRGPDDYG